MPGGAILGVATYAIQVLSADDAAYDVIFE